ncbi:UDP-glucose:glycoprotein glucosyltransferase [Xylariaceae sp. FL1019]|nr:UDP-glucose:glycoprotein glucosyltransferase [Xylariaceae sp. FL1019]
MIRIWCLPCGLAAALLAVLSLAPGHVAAGPSVNVAMKAAFPAPPYLIELLETAAGENATAYFPLLDRIADGSFAAATTDQALYTKFLQVLHDDGHITSPPALSTFKLALSLRTAAPRIEAHYQYYDTTVTPSLGDAKPDCDEWVFLTQKQYCSSTLAHSDGQFSSDSQLRHLPFDRSMGNGPEAILYADINLPQFGAFHKTLATMARKGEISYRLRYRIPHRDEAEALPISGYGVELQLKRTDYIVIDDREASEAVADREENVASLESVLDQEDDFTDLKPLSTKELANLGLKAGSFVMESEDPFETLIKLTQDFPKFSTSVAFRNASEDFVKEHKWNRAVAAPAGINVLWMNGVQIMERQIDPFTLVDSIRRERAFMKGVTDLGLSPKEAISLLGNQQVAMAKAADEAPRFDWTDRPEDGRVIVWLNDIEKDKRYADFPSELTSLLKPTFPGQIPQIRKNLFNIVIPVDFSKLEDIRIVTEQLQGLVKRALPLHFGLVPLTPTKEAEDQAKVVYHLIQNYGLASFMLYLEFGTAEGIAQADPTLFEKAIEDRKLKEEASVVPFDQITTWGAYVEQLSLARQWTKRLEANGQEPPVFINGFVIPRDANWLTVVSQRVSVDLQETQRAVYMGLLDDTMWAPDFFLQDALPRRNHYLFPDEEHALRVLNIHKIYSENARLLDRSPVIKADDGSDRESWALLTVIVDLGTSSGRQLLLSTLAFRRDHPGVRIDIVHNPAYGEKSQQINDAIVENSSKLLEITNLESLDALLSGSTEPQNNAYGLDLAKFSAATGIPQGAHALLLNGRVIGPIDPLNFFQEDDFKQLLGIEQTTRILPVYRALTNLDLIDKVSSPLAAAKLTSITALSTLSDIPEGIFESAQTLRSTVYDSWNSSHTAIDIGDPESANIHLVALLNPTSEQGQRWSPILKVLSELEGVFVRIFINPREKLEELPIKRFYRSVLQSEPSFDTDGGLRSQGATFKGLPTEALLNLGMDMPPAWLVAAKDSVHDLDNLKLSSMKSDVEAVYELEHIVIEGHSREQSGKPPRGVQLLLGTERDPHFADTIIMANIGYFQFKANPGYYNISLQEGRSSEIFDIVSVGSRGYDAVPGDEGTEVALMDFQGTTLYPRLQRKDEMANLDVLDDGPSAVQNDILSRGLRFAEGILGGSKSGSKSLSNEIHAEINIFSVASGHLYERMLKIMIVSVMKNTKHTVKFWFIEQFLSPSFKESIPHLAEEYKFRYEMVTYKWPHWLRAQKEKQREIWGYKILFLDVLFPLSLDKVIFVDADQIVRTDMIDLINHDLKGAPYGFTPMCDSRTEMEGFRFWKQGYWETYLRGQPYHISALYVVDLRRFRQMAAGDRLRQQYQALSADPASLSNLDQDLPNHMQFQIPIHSLPQEWLWCETWCSDESQKQARTIDLCNNPQTKEPKLERARRQIPEWTVYDDEIAAAEKKRKNLGGDDGTEGFIVGGEGTNTRSRRLAETPAQSVKDEL